MSDETTPQDGKAMSPASAGSTVNVGQELVSRLRAFNDRLVVGQSFERVTRIRCHVCRGAGVAEMVTQPGGKATCPCCGGVGSVKRRERIDPLNVSYYGDGRVVIRDQQNTQDQQPRTKEAATMSDENERSVASDGSTANSDFFERVVKEWLKDATQENFADFERCREVLDEQDPESHESVPGHVARLCGFYFAAANEAQRNPDPEEPYASWLWHTLTIAKKAYRMGLRDGRKET